MTLSPGTTLGSFEISGLLGVGGMGEVYRARDTKLGREVAIKVLPDLFAKDKDRLARFEREAKLLASLDHPNIAAIYDLQEEGGVRFLVMQLVEGQTLAERIAAGAIPVDEALPLFVQIAEALEDAHEHGIIHRDLKPANIKVTQEGKVKVLDFGLAKAFEQATPASSSPGGTLALDSEPDALSTGEGKVLGTPAYMSPEQASGKAVDKRADIWAFGCCLYEALTGQRPFQGDSAPELLARILEREPDWAALPDGLPQRIHYLIRRCLAKNPRRRARDIGDLAVTIDDTITESQSDAGRAVAAARTDGAPRVISRIFPWFLAAGAVIALIFVFATSSRQPGRGARTAGARIRSLAVMPFENLMEEAGKDYYVDGMTDTLTTELSKIRSIKVIARTSAMRFKNTRMSPSQIAEALGVEALVEGSVQQFGDELRITAKLVDAQSETQVWADYFDGAFEQVMKLQGEVAVAIADQIGAALTPEQREGYTAAPDVDPEAYDLYLRGRSLAQSRKGENLREAITLFEQATKNDDEFALGFAALAEAYARLFDFLYAEKDEVRGFAERYARRALKLDDELAEAHTSMGIVHYLFNPDWRASQREFLRAIELNSGLAASKRVYGVWLALMGRTQESLGYLDEAVALDPTSALVRTARARAYTLARRYDEALEDYEAALGLDPELPSALFWLSSLYILMDRNEDAMEVDERRTELFPQSSVTEADVSETQALAGDPEPARRVLLMHASGELDGLIPGDSLVRLQLALGNLEGAFELFQPRTFPPHSMWAARIDPRWDVLRDDPRFWEIIDELDLPPLPPEHPLFEPEQDWKLRRKAEELLAQTPGPVRRTSINLGPGESWPEFTVAPLIALSFDGKQLVYVAVKDGRNQVFHRPLERLVSTVIPGSERTAGVYISPSGRWLALRQSPGIFKLPLSGGAAQLIVNTALIRAGIDWDGEDAIYYATGLAGGLNRVAASGGPPEVVTEIDENEVAHFWPSLLPGSKFLLFSTIPTSDAAGASSSLYALELETGRRELVIEGAMYARYLPTGHLLYSTWPSDPRLMIVPFDPESLAVSGKPVRVLPDVLISPNSRCPQLAYSADGTLVYVPRIVSRNRVMVWVDRQGNEETIALPAQAFESPRLSPDGESLIFTIDRNANADVWRYDLTPGKLSQLTSHPSTDYSAIWSSDASRIYFTSQRAGPFDVFSKSADGSGEVERITQSDEFQWPRLVSPDGSSIIYQSLHADSGYDLGLAPVAGDGEPELLLQGPFAETDPSISPDGRWIAYVSDETGREEVYVRSYPELTGKQKVSSDGGMAPLWAPGGGELFYTTQNRLFSVAVRTDPTFSASKPEVLLEGPYFFYSTASDEGRQYDISPLDGRFLLLRADERSGAPSAEPSMVVVDNWFEELKRLSPTEP